MAMHLHKDIQIDGPFNWGLMLRYAARRNRDLVDVVTADHQYRRLLVGDHGPFLLQVGANPSGTTALTLAIQGIAQDPAQDDLAAAETAVRRVFGLDQSPQPFYDAKGNDPVLGPLIARLHGLRPLGSPSIFEMLINAILGQQISMIAAHAIKERLVRALGAAAQIDGAIYQAFPTPEALARTEEAALVDLKFSRGKASYARGLAQSIVEGQLDLEALRGKPHDKILTSLTAIRGIGRWTAEYVLLRGYGYPDALPAGDAGLRRQIHRHYALPAPPSDQEMSAIAEAWRPYRSWATLYLWSAEWADTAAVEEAVI